MRSLVLLLCTGLTCCTAAGSSPPAAEAALLREDATLAQLLEAGREHVPAAKAQVKFNLRSSPDAEEDGCPLAVGHRERLEDCKFNATAKTFFIIHGWTMSGMFETWLGSLVSALQKREKDANVVVVDWLSLAHQLYTDAVNNTQIVGKSIARLLDWLQENPLFQLENVHLIGYSLGAHVAGFAGNHVHGTIGRITAIGEVVKCEHERSVHLFVDSLVNQDKQSFAFQCTDSSRFKKGICLSCRKNRCSGIGYNARKTRNKRNSKMYLKTRADMPFKVYHFQMKMHVFSYKSLGEADPTFSVTLHGTNGDSEPLSLEMLDQIGLNATNTFLVYTEKDMGELLKIKLTWEGTSQSWYDLWKELKSYWYRPVKSSQELHIRRIRVKSGETQQRFAFCVEDSQLTNISPGKELWFVKCTGEWQKRSVSNSL
ncbi:endothelial lipase isoform X2 [Aquila chrysaetos chrysaetos]|uniref:endothelial lipase isoform X2 n=1 Tax=Aquila chrysaetos chrysaetos TaxID=223781 RepID=UPI001176A755|nr:endothelial lipase isoform X2 [Aquila chrysaetos chrysaetos]